MRRVLPRRARPKRRSSRPAVRPGGAAATSVTARKVRRCPDGRLPGGYRSPVVRRRSASAAPGTRGSPGGGVASTAGGGASAGAGGATSVGVLATGGAGAGTGAGGAGTGAGAGAGGGAGGAGAGGGPAAGLAAPVGG